MSPPQAFSICLAVLGILIITFQKSPSNIDSSPMLFGNILVFGAVISEALFTIFAKKLSTVFTPIQMATAVNIIGFLLFLPFAVREALSFDFMNLKLSVWLLIVYYAITASVLSFVLWYQGVKKVNASLAGIFTGFIPIAATLVGIFLLKETFSWNQFMGILCVLGAILLGTRVKAMKEEEHQTQNISS